MILLQKENFRNLNGKNRTINKKVVILACLPGKLKGLFKGGCVKKFTLADFEPLSCIKSFKSFRNLLQFFDHFCGHANFYTSTIFPPRFEGLWLYACGKLCAANKLVFYFSFKTAYILVIACATLDDLPIQANGSSTRQSSKLYKKSVALSYISFCCLLPDTGLT